MPKLPVPSVLVRVAKEVGPSFDAVARQSYALSLFLFCVIIDQDRIDRAIEDSGRMDNAGLMALAFHEPKKLRKLELQLSNAAAPVVTKEVRLTRMAEAKALIEKKLRQTEGSNGKL